MAMKRKRRKRFGSKKKFYLNKAGHVFYVRSMPLTCTKKVSEYIS